jgi:hypothetical protein
MLVFIFKSGFKKVDWCWKREKSFMPIDSAVMMMPENLIVFDCARKLVGM